MATPATHLDHDAVHEQVREIVRQLLMELGSHRALDAVRPAAHLERDLGLGSLERVELILRLAQAFGVHLPDSVVAEANTLEDLTAAVLRATEADTSPEFGEAEIFSAPLAHVRRHADALSRVEAAVASAETLNEVLERHVRADPRRPQIYLREDPPSGAQHAEPYLITYADLHERASAVARGLVERGLSPRQTVAIMLPTCRDFFYSFYGVLLAGGIPVPIYPPFRADRIEEYAARQAAILRNAEARILITFRQAETIARLLKPSVPSLTAVVLAARIAETPAKAGVNFYKPRGDDIAFIQYTSGSTGDPKGVTLTHSNLLANMRAIAEAVAMGPGDVGVSWLPLYHDMGLIGAWLTLLYTGVPVAVMSPLSFLTRPERWLWAFHHHRGTIAAAPNFAFELCVRKIADRDIEGLDLSSWRAALNGAEPVNPETLERFAARFSKYGFKPEAMLPVYGLAEASLAVTVPPLNRGPRVDRIERETFQAEGRAIPVAGNGGESANVLAFVSSGCAVPRHEVRIVDAGGHDAGQRVEGQLWFRGPSATQGYYRNHEATAKILREGGWIDSGDRAYAAEGEIYITGRVKDIIIKGGRNLYPHEVEEVAGSAAGIRKGCVVAFGSVDDQSGTERLVVVAETREKKLDDKATGAIIAQVTAKLLDGLGLPPDVVELLPAGSIPKTSSGKLRRNETKKLYQMGKLGRGKPPVWVQVAKLGAASSTRAAQSGLRRALELAFGVWSGVAFIAFLLPTWLLAYLAPSRETACQVTQKGTRVFFWLIGCRIRINGAEHLQEGLPFVFVSNHTSFLDVVLYLATLKFIYRFVSKREVLAWPFIGTFLRKRQDFAFNREDPRARLDQAEALEDALRQGESLLIFPEGTFVAAEGLRPFQLGAFKAAVATGRPVCPVALRGVREIFRDETRLLKPGSITMTFCPPLHPRPGASDWHEIVRLRDAARAAISRHCGEHIL